MGYGLLPPPFESQANLGAGEPAWADRPEKVAVDGQEPEREGRLEHVERGHLLGEGHPDGPWVSRRMPMIRGSPSNLG